MVRKESGESPEPLFAGGKVSGEGVLYEPAGAPLSVWFAFDVVDRLNADAMRGLAAVPRRGAEVGGVLLGRVESGPVPQVRVEDYAPVELSYSRGPSFLLSPEEVLAFGSLVDAGRAAEGGLRPVGFYRTDTREAMHLGEEDLALLDLHFPDVESICLLIRPYASKTAQAAWLWRSAGAFSSAVPQRLIPFRRKELGGGQRQRRRPSASGAGELPQQDQLPFGTVSSSTPEDLSPRGGDSTNRGSTNKDASPLAESAPPSGAVDWVPSFGGLAHRPVNGDASSDAEAAPSSSGRWQLTLAAIPVAVLFLLSGGVAGFLISRQFPLRFPDLAFAPANGVLPARPLRLQAACAAGTCGIEWDSSLWGTQPPQSGELVLEKDGQRHVVELSRTDLERRSLRYPGQPGTRISLSLSLNDAASIHESTVAQETAPSQRPADGMAPAEPSRGAGLGTQAGPGAKKRQ